MMRSARAGTRDVLDRLTEWLLRPLRRATGHILVAPLYSLYTARLWLEVLAHPVPRHLAVILDGNRRFAERVGLDVRAGYAEGGGRVADVLKAEDESSDETRDVARKVVETYAALGHDIVYIHRDNRLVAADA